MTIHKADDFFVESVDMEMYMRLQAQEAYAAHEMQHKMARQMSDPSDNYMDQDCRSQTDSFHEYGHQYPAYYGNPEVGLTVLSSSMPELSTLGHHLHFPTPAPTRGSSPHVSSYNNPGFNLELVHHHPISGSSSQFDISLPYDIENENLTTPELSPPTNLSLDYYSMSQGAQNYDDSEYSGCIFPLEPPVVKTTTRRKPAVKKEKPQGSGQETEGGKRTQVKVACIHCKKACKKCDEARPCSRCVRIGLNESCTDAPRKERKKGFKRGPYNKFRRESVDSNAEWNSNVESESEYQTESPHYPEKYFGVKTESTEKQKSSKMKKSKSKYQEETQPVFGDSNDSQMETNYHGFEEEVPAYYYPNPNQNTQYVSPMSIFQPVV